MIIAVSKGQRGQALLSAMVLVSLMGVLSVSGMRSALLESRITDVQRQQELAFQQAESVLNFARTELVQHHLDETTQDPGLVVSYPVPDVLARSAYATDESLITARPQLTLRTLSQTGSLVSGRRAAAGLNNAWVEINVVTYNVDGSPAVALQELVLRSAEGGA